MHSPVRDDSEHIGDAIRKAMDFLGILTPHFPQLRPLLDLKTSWLIIGGFSPHFLIELL